VEVKRIAAAALVAGGLVLAVHLAGCGWAEPTSSGPRPPRTTAPGGSPSGTAAPETAASDGPRRPFARGPLGPVRPGSVGQDIRYLGEDGRITNLDVPDFPR